LNFDFLQYFSWYSYAVTVILYTALVLHGEFSKKDGPLILSKQNARPLSEIFTIHFAFLAVLLGFMRFAPHIYFRLPGWMIAPFGRAGSAFDYFFIFAMAVMHFIERRWLYVALSKSEKLGPFLTRHALSPPTSLRDMGRPLFVAELKKCCVS
jgi:hypothetical protein